MELRDVSSIGTAPRGPSVWVLALALSAAVVVLGVELNYRYGFRALRTVEDLPIRTLAGLHARRFRSVLFSDSMTHDALRDYRVAPDVLNLTTTGSPTLLGIRFMFERFLAQSNRAEEVVLFLRPDFLSLDVSSLQPGIFLWFDRPAEVEELTRSGVRGFSALDVSLKNRVDALNLLNEIVNRGRLRKRPFVRSFQLERDVITRRFETLRPAHLEVGTQARRVLDRFVELCQKHGMRLTLVLEPMMPKDIRKARGSAVFQHLAALGTRPGVRFVDANQILDVEEAMFFDGVHPRRHWARYYLIQVDRTITPILGNPPDIRANPYGAPM